MLRFTITKKGFPAIWESGGSARNTGNAICIADKAGNAKIPVYICRRGHLSCADHALFIVERGDWVCVADHHRLDYNIYLYQIDSIQEVADDDVSYVKKYEYTRGEWTGADPPVFLSGLIEAAKEKAACYHCRTPHFVREFKPV